MTAQRPNQMFKRLGRCLSVPLAVAGLLAVLACSPPSTQAQLLPPREAQSLETQALMIRTQAGTQHFFTVEVADDRREQGTGLMFREYLAPDRGMIFVYDKPRPIGMWMKNTLIGLDMLFVNGQGRILNIHQGAVPGSLQSIRSAGPAVAVIELADGQAGALNLAAGDTVFHCRFANFPCDWSPAQ